MFGMIKYIFDTIVGICVKMSFVLILFSVLTGTDIEIFPLKKRQYSKLTWTIFNIFAYYIYYLDYYEWYKSYKSYSGGEE